MRILKTIHGWIGFFVFPWIVMIGLTGFYLNHSRTILDWLPKATWDESQIADWPDKLDLDQSGALGVAARVWPGESFEISSSRTYHDFDVFQFKADRGRIIVATGTGHYWVKTDFIRHTFDPEGKRLDTKIYWGPLFKTLHSTGWIDSTFGSLLADLVALAMVFFGFTGVYLFIAPRVRRMRNRMRRRPFVPAEEPPLRLHSRLRV